MLRASITFTVVLSFMILMLPAHGSQPLHAQQAPGAGGRGGGQPPAAGGPIQSIEDARKAVFMFHQVRVPILGIVENMSYFIAPDTGNRYDIFGHGGAANAAEELGIDFLGEIPIEPAVREGADTGVPVVYGHPESESAQAIVRIAGSIAARLSVLQRMGA